MAIQPITIVEGRGLPLRGDDIDTDRIIPARFLRTVTFLGLDRHLFEDDRKTPGHPLDDPRYQGARVLVVNKNFGCGSSREHAPQALHEWGIRAVVGESFSEIFFGNAAMIGLPCVSASQDDVRELLTLVERAPETVVTVDLQHDVCTAGARRVPVRMPARTREALLTGAWDSTGLLRDRFEEVEATAARLPYVSGFSSPPTA
ncbi:MAG: 3-isopropylmalate dehydratase small subunit [Vicinamibacterales bacterium]